MACHQYVVFGIRAPSSLGSPHQDWPSVSGAPHMVKKALHRVVRETLEKLSALVPRENVG